MLLLLAGDVEICPGPQRLKNLKCCVCITGIRKSQTRNSCSGCEGIAHLKCLQDFNYNGPDESPCNMCCGKYEESICCDHEGNVQDPYLSLSINLAKRGLKVFHQNINGLLSKVWT